MSSEQTGAPAPQGDYRPALLHDGVVYTAGMTPRRDGELVLRGVVGDTVSAGQAFDAAGIAYTVETDELGFTVTRDGVHVHDLQATILHLLGFDHERLTFRFQGRDFRLTDVHGHVVKEILA